MNVGFSENFAYVLTDWSPGKITLMIIDVKSLFILP